MSDIERLIAKMGVLKADRLRLADQLIETMVERAMDLKIARRLIEATWPTPDDCRVCGGTVTDEGTGHKPDCAWQEARERFVEEG